MLTSFHQGHQARFQLDLAGAYTGRCTRKQSPCRTTGDHVKVTEVHTWGIGDSRGALKDLKEPGCMCTFLWRPHSSQGLHGKKEPHHHIHCLSVSSRSLAAPGLEWELATTQSMTPTAWELLRGREGALAMRQRQRARLQP